MKNLIILIFVVFFASSLMGQNSPGGSDKKFNSYTIKNGKLTFRNQPVSKIRFASDWAKTEINLEADKINISLEKSLLVIKTSAGGYTSAIIYEINLAFIKYQVYQGGDLIIVY